jgi:hypothetical protein
MTQVIAVPLLALVAAGVVWTVLYTAIRNGVRDGIRNANPATDRG